MQYAMDFNDSVQLIQSNVAELYEFQSQKILLNKSKNQIKKTYFSHIFFQLIFLMLMWTRKIQRIKL